MIAHTSKNLSDVGAEKRTMSYGLTDSETAEVMRWKEMMGFETLSIRGRRIIADGDSWTMEDVQRDLDDHDAEIEQADVRELYNQ
jgi:hypothetical protein